MKTKTILRHIQAAERVLLVCHQRPDGDTLGAAFAFARFLDSLGRSYRGYCRTPVPEAFSFLGDLNFVTHNDNALAAEAFDVVIVFDSSNLEHAGCDQLLARLRPRPIIVNFDHHASNTFFGDVNVVDVGASSASEIVFRFFKAAGWRVDTAAATALLFGIAWDTGRFSNPATTPGAYAAAAQLMNAGADYKHIDAVMKQKSVQTLQFWGKILSQVQQNQRLGFASVVIRQADLETAGATEEDCWGIANFLNSLDETRGVMVLREEKDGTLKGSLRTKDELLDMEKIAKIMGIISGGGHKKSSGFSLPGKIEKTTRGFRVI